MISPLSALSFPVGVSVFLWPFLTHIFIFVFSDCCTWIEKMCSLVGPGNTPKNVAEMH